MIRTKIQYVVSSVDLKGEWCYNRFIARFMDECPSAKMDISVSEA